MKELLLRTGIVIQPFHGMVDEECYIISFRNCNWKVSEFVVDVIYELQKTSSYDTLVQNLLNKYQSCDVEKATIQAISFLEQNDLIDDGSQTNQFNKNRQGNTHLWGRITILPGGTVCKIRILCFLFYKPLLIVLSILSFLWVAYAFSTSSAIMLAERIVRLPLSQLMTCYGVMLIIGFLHEIGHSSALMFFGEKPGRIGVAFYMLSCVLFSDVTCAWKLKRKARLLVDYGGIYFQSIFSGLLFLINSLWLHNATLEIVALCEAVSILGNFNPFFKYDGYWLVSDTLGSTNVFRMVVVFWKEVLHIGTKNDKAYHLPKKLKPVVVLYSVGSIVFMVYFVVFLFAALSNAFSLIYADFSNMFSCEVALTPSNVLHYVLNRFSAYLIIVLAARMLVKSIIKLFNIFSKKGERYAN